MNWENLTEKIKNEFESKGHTCEHVRAYPTREICRDNVMMMKTATAVVNGRVLCASAESESELISLLWINYKDYQKKENERIILEMHGA
jgi:hypothetical protein